MKKFKYRDSAAKRKQRAEARANGREGNAAYTSGAREVGFPKDSKALNKEAWETKQKVQTYTSSKNGRMSVDGKKAGGSTWTFTQKDGEGNTVRQSGRSKVATRRQRYYDVRVGLGMSGG